MSRPETTSRQVAEYYTIELAQLAEGAIYVSITATTVDDVEPQLLSQEIASERVYSLDSAFALIKQSISGAQ